MALAEALNPAPPAAPVELRPLLIELNCLKRIRSAGREGSIAARLFARSWALIAAGQDAEDVALETTAAALAAARLGDIDEDLLAEAGLAPELRLDILRQAVAAIARPLDRRLHQRLLAALDGRLPAGDAPPAFVARLAAQPRAGVTCPGRARVMLDEPENHAEHSVLVAIYAVLLAPTYDAHIGEVFLASLAHHAHNTGLPDSGFTGEVLLGDRLQEVMDAFSSRALAELDPSIRATVERARMVLVEAETPEGQAFQAADVIDRVAEIAGRLAAANLTMDAVLGEMALVHDGLFKPFQDRVLAEMALP